jgi:uncharacterized protein (DUF362 family)
MSQISRRRFLKMGASAAGFAAASQALGNTPDGIVRAAAPAAPVAIGRCRTYDYTAIKSSLSSLFDLLGNVATLVNGKFVVIKVIAHPPDDIDSLDQFMTYDTHPEVVKAAARLFLDAGATHVTVTESVYRTSGGAADFAWVGYDTASFETELGASNITFRNCRNREGYPDYADRPVGPGSYLYDFFRLNRVFDFADTDGVFVSIAKMKNHQIAGVTLALKNLFGMAPCAWYGQDAYSEGSTQYRGNAFHNAYSSYTGRNANGSFGGAGENVPRVITDLNRARPIHFAILDGITLCHGSEGPWTRTPMGIASPGLLLAGANPVCVDAVGCGVMGYDPQAADYQYPWANGKNHLALGTEKEVGTNDLSQIEVRGISIADARYDIPPTPDT